MNAYGAILAAASHIERHPEFFNFNAVALPDTDCGTHGCALGWIGFFAGLRPDETRDYGFCVLRAANEVLGLNDKDHVSSVFYDRMTDLAGHPLYWRERATECARVLRLYAEKYHGNEKPRTTPDWWAMAQKQTIPEGPISSPEYAS